MFFSSSILSIFGVMHVVQTILSNSWTLEAIYTESFVHRSVILFFTCSNIMDLLIGFKYYPKYLDPISTIAHHIFYIIFMLALLANHYSSGFQLCFLMEVPTFILAAGIIYKSLRSDILFGVSFLITRILYNAFLAYKLAMLSPTGIIWKICICVLCLHLYWFHKWCNVYGLKAVSSQSKLIELN